MRTDVALIDLRVCSFFPLACSLSPLLRPTAPSTFRSRITAAPLGLPRMRALLHPGALLLHPPPPLSRPLPPPRVQPALFQAHSASTAEAAPAEAPSASASAAPRALRVAEATIVAHAAATRPLASSAAALLLAPNQASVAC